MTKDLFNPRTATVQDVKVPLSGDKDLIDLLKKVKEKLEEEIANPRGGNIQLFELIFSLLANLGIHGTVFQTGRLEDTDENNPQKDITFIFSGDYELKKGKEVWYSTLPTGKFKAVVIGEVDKTPPKP